MLTLTTVAPPTLGIDHGLVGGWPESRSAPNRARNYPSAGPKIVQRLKPGEPGRAGQSTRVDAATTASGYLRSPLPQREGVEPWRIPGCEQESFITRHALEVSQRGAD